MKNLKLTLVSLLTASAMFAQNITEKRSINPFTKLEVSGAANVVLEKSDSATLRIEAAQKDLQNIIIESKDGELVIKTKGNINESFKIIVGYQNISFMNISGAANVSSEDTMKVDKIDVILSGASKLKLNLNGKDVSTNLSGAATAILGGYVGSHKSEVSGASSLKSSRLITNSTDVSASGGSTAKVFATQKLVVNASGASSVKYGGNPPDKSLNRTSASTINNAELAEAGKLDSNEGVTPKNEGDTTRLKLGDKRVYIFDNDDEKNKNKNNNNKDGFKHFAGIEIGMNGFLSPQNSTDLDSKYDYMEMDYGARSLYWGLNLFEKDFHLYKNYLNLVTGLGFGFNTYQFKNRISLDADSSFTWYSNDSLVDYKKNKLKTSFIQVPLMLEYNSSKKPKKSFHLAAGVLLGYKMISKTKQTTTVNGHDIKNVKKDDYNINPFRYSATVRIGYAGVTAFATYALNSLFEDKKGPEVYPFTMGVLIPFN